MEVIDYEMPDSWNSKGMSWKNPEPERVDYFMAIRGAIMERCAALHTSVNSEIMKISPHKPVTRSAMAACVSQIRGLAGSFVNMDWDEYEEDLSDYPKMWTYHDLLECDGCNLYDFAGPGDPCGDGGAWLKAIKAALDKLTVILPRSARGTVVTRSGSEHDPPFGESIGNAMSYAMQAKPTKFAGGLSSLSVYGWSGNTHWKWPRPKKEDEDGGGGLDEDEEENKNGYCGYAQSHAYTITSVGSWLYGRDCELLMAAVAKRPEGPVPYSSVLDVATFDSGRAGFKEGTSFLSPVHITWGEKLEIKIGDPDAIPKNSSVPTSEWDEDGNPIRRHSCKVGYSADVKCLLDYGVRNGFRFQEGS